jgi:hypothetical protein
MLPASPVPVPGLATFEFTGLTTLHEALDRVYKLGVSLPDAPLARYRARTADLPQTTEAGRFVIQRISQDIFRAALMDYWGSRCPVTGITDPALLRASHIVPWAECDDAQRLACITASFSPRSGMRPSTQASSASPMTEPCSPALN